MAIRAGQLRHRVTIQEPTETANEYGELERTWTTYATRWARIEPLSGRELEFAAQRVATASHKVTMRHDSGITQRMRLRFGTRTFDIGAIINAEEVGEEMTVLVTESV